MKPAQQRPTLVHDLAALALITCMIGYPQARIVNPAKAVYVGSSEIVKVAQRFVLR